jgi:predicted outer membrane repeat protein
MPAGGSTGGSTESSTPQPPTVDAFDVGAPVGLDVPILDFSVSGSGVSGYMITTSPLPPLASDPNWLSQIPKSFGLPGPGGYVLFPWAKNGDGVSQPPAFARKVFVCAPTIQVSSAADSGEGSLRQALVDICPKGTIGLAPSLNITLQSPLEVNKEVTILGQPSTDMPTLSGNDTVQIMRATSFLTLRSLKLVHGKGAVGGLEALAGADIADVSFDSNQGKLAGALYFDAYGPAGSRLQNCDFTNNTGGRFGGAIVAEIDPDVAEGRDPVSVPQDLVINGCRFNGNTAWSGGGIANMVHLGVIDSRFNDNHAYQDGGALYNTGKGFVEVSASEFADNTADDNGGGLFNEANGRVWLDSSSLVHNTAGLDGGGMYNQGNGAALIMNSSFSNNQAEGLGGALSSSANLGLLNSTLFGNAAGQGGGLFTTNSGLILVNSTIVSNTGGGLVRGVQGFGSMENTILAGNSPNCGEEAPSQPKHGLHAVAINLSDDDTCADASLTTDLNLGIFGNHGGPTNSIPLLASSSAIDTGSTTVCNGPFVNHKDQRGVARPPTHCSMGAFEPAAAILVIKDLTVVPNGGSVDLGTVPVGSTFTVTFTVAHPMVGNTGEGAGTLVLQEPITVPSGFTIASSFLKTSLAHRESTTFQVTMNTDVPGIFSGPLSFANDLAGSTPFSFTIHGKVGCETGQYLDSTTVSCKTCSTCATGTFQSAACSTTADSVCTPCSGGCPYGYYTAVDCTPTADRVCRYLGIVNPPPSDPANLDVDGGADGSVTPPGAEPDAEVAPDAQVAVDTLVAMDTKPATPDSQIAQDTQASGQPDTAGIQPSGDAQARPDTQVVIGGDMDAQADAIAIETDARMATDAAGADSVLVAMDARTGDAARDSAKPDTSPDTLAVAQPDARISDTPSADVSGGKKDESSCTCNLSGHASRSSGGLAMLLLGLALAARSRRRK